VPGLKFEGPVGIPSRAFLFGSCVFTLY